MNLKDHPVIQGNLVELRKTVSPKGPHLVKETISVCINNFDEIKKNKIQILRWLMEMVKLNNMMEDNPYGSGKQKKRSLLEYAFELAVKTMNIFLIKYFVKKYKMDIHQFDDLSLRTVVTNGNRELTVWLCENAKKKLPKDLLKLAVTNDHLKLVKYFVNIHGYECTNELADLAEFKGYHELVEFFENRECYTSTKIWLNDLILL